MNGKQWYPDIPFAILHYSLQVPIKTWFTTDMGLSENRVPQIIPNPMAYHWMFPVKMVIWRHTRR